MISCRISTRSSASEKVKLQSLDPMSLKNDWGHSSRSSSWFSQSSKLVVTTIRSVQTTNGSENTSWSIHRTTLTSRSPENLNITVPLGLKIPFFGLQSFTAAVGVGYRGLVRVRWPRKTVVTIHSFLRGSFLTLLRSSSCLKFALYIIWVVSC